MIEAAASLQPLPRFVTVRDEPIETNAKKGLKTAASGVITPKIFLFNRSQEKSLHHVFGVFVRRLPLDTDVLVGWFPVARDDCLQRPLAHLRLSTAHCSHRRITGLGKSIAGAADVGIGIHLSAVDYC